MENEAETSSSRVHVVAALFLLVVMSLWLFQVQDVWQVALLLVAGMLVVVPPLRRWSLVDGVIVVLAVCSGRCYCLQSFGRPVHPKNSGLGY